MTPLISTVNTYFKISTSTKQTEKWLEEENPFNTSSKDENKSKQQKLWCKAPRQFY